LQRRGITWSLTSLSIKSERSVDFSCIQSRQTLAKFSGILKNGMDMIFLRNYIWY
jgi:hypothetical protein